MRRNLQDTWDSQNKHQPYQSFIFKRDRKATREDTEQAYLQGNERIFTQTKGAPLTIRPMIDELYYIC